MLLTVVLAVAVPLSFLYLIHWLDLYGSDRPRIVITCVVWGLIAFVLAVLVNRFCIYIVGLPFKFVSTRTAPFVEEVFKAGVLIWLVQKGRLTYFVDGAIYGFASGMGFAAIENLRYIQLFPQDPFALVIIRDFSSALAHGTMTAMTGIGFGLYALSARGKRHSAPIVLGFAGAMALHYAWNIFGWNSPWSRHDTEWVLVGVGLTGVMLVSLTIIWGIHRERLQLRDSLGLKVGVSAEEASVVQHLDDLNHLLAPIERRFGKVKRRHVAEFLHLEAQLGLDEQRLERGVDPKMRAELAAQIASLKGRVDAERRNVGVYVMLYVRSIFPDTSWSLWARLGQTLTKTRSHGLGMWGRLAPAVGSGAVPPEGMYARANGALDSRARLAAPTMRHVHELPEAMQRYMLWVMKEFHVTAQHAAKGLGHHEAHAHEILNHLVARGFLHREPKGGEVAFRTRVLPDEASAARPHLWHTLAQRTTKKNQGGGA